MEQKINDGGPAFPVTTIQPDGNGSMMPDYTIPGMSLLDYFAAKAMAGILSQWTEFNRAAGTSQPTERRISHLAMRSYDIADAMLRARAEADARRSQQEPQTDGVAGAPQPQSPTVDHP